MDKNMKETVIKTLRRRAERAVEMVKAEPCVFFMNKDDPELNRLITAICIAGFKVEKLADDYIDVHSEWRSRSPVTTLSCP